MIFLQNDKASFDVELRIEKYRKVLVMTNHKTGVIVGRLLPLPERELPCNSCETGEYVQNGYTQPSGQTYYHCSDCGHRISFP